MRGNGSADLALVLIKLLEVLDPEGDGDIDVEKDGVVVVVEGSPAGRKRLGGSVEQIQLWGIEGPGKVWIST